MFRFEDLAAELRIKIYRFLLVKENNDRGKKLWPSIMAISKKINREAEDVMYKDTTLRITHRVGNASYQLKSQLGTQTWNSHKDPHVKEMFATYRAWMPAITKFRSVSLSFTDSGGQPLLSLERATGHLFAMASFLAVTESKIQSVTFDVSEVALRSSFMFCWPTSTLPHVEMVLNGVDDEFASQLRNRWTEQPALPLNRFWAIEAEARELHDKPHL